MTEETIIEGTARDVTPATAVAVAPASAPSMPAVTVDKLRVLGNALGGDLNANELVLFAEVANRSGLDPFARQIYAIRRKGRVTFQTGIDGYRSIAARTGEYDGQDEPVFGAWQDRPWGHPESATVRVYRKGMSRGVAATAYWDEYVPQSESDQFMWKRMPRVMLAKVAEALALRKAFPYVYGGLYTDDEMAQAGDDGPLASHDTAPRAQVAEGRMAGPDEYEGPVTKPADGLRSTANGKKLEFAITVGRSKHNVEIFEPLAALVLPWVQAEGAMVRVTGKKIEEDYPNRGTKPMKKVIREVRRVEVQGAEGGWNTVAENQAASPPDSARAAAEPPAPVSGHPDDGPLPFEDGDIATVARTPHHGDASGTADVTGTIASHAWATTPSGTRYVMLEVDDPGSPGRFWKVAVSDLDQVPTDDLGEPLWAKGDPIRIIGGWNAKGAVIVATIVLDPRTETAAPAGKE